MTESITRLRDNIQSVFYGNNAAVDQVICCLLARGHVLIEDVPGVGKTVLATALARSLDCSFSRIQLTPDMLPGDVLGVTVFDRDTARFELKRGPIFANIVLADEVNRTTPRTQSAMLEAMNENSVSIEGRTIDLEQPFMVVATQNPYEFEGTYPLPESQLDRFLMRIHVGYPSPEDEARVLERRPGAQGRHAAGEDEAIGALRRLKPVMSREEVLGLQERVDGVRMERSLIDYIIALGAATRSHEELEVGVSPRGTLALAQAARATAVLRERDHCVPEDVSDNVVSVFTHRVVCRAYSDNGHVDTGRRIVESVLESVDSPA
ncbi:MAG: AAA family ATPase [Phycisphaerales bacterium]|nr:MAG: AAA family ATPase [Phycisphaerales bacterium]